MNLIDDNNLQFVEHNVQEMIEDEFNNISYLIFLKVKKFS